MSEVWETVRAIFTPAFAILAGGAVFKLLFSGRIDDLKGSKSDAVKAANDERDRAIEDRNRALKSLEAERAKHEHYKAHWKDLVIAQREERRLDEAAIVGAPSVPPLTKEEPTGVFYVNEAADQEYRRASEERRARLAREREDLTREYNEAMRSDPPARLLPPPRKKLPSRNDR